MRDESDRIILRHALEFTGSASDAAEYLGKERGWFYKKAQELGVKLPPQKHKRREEEENVGCERELLGNLDDSPLPDIPDDEEEDRRAGSGEPGIEEMPPGDPG